MSKFDDDYKVYQERVLKMVEFIDAAGGVSDSFGSMSGISLNQWQLLQQKRDVMKRLILDKICGRFDQTFVPESVFILYSVTGEFMDAYVYRSTTFADKYWNLLKTVILDARNAITAMDAKAKEGILPC